jgi:hypothetical protein
MKRNNHSIEKESFLLTDGAEEADIFPDHATVLSLVLSLLYWLMVHRRA